MNGFNESTHDKLVHLLRTCKAMLKWLVLFIYNLYVRVLLSHQHKQINLRTISLYIYLNKMIKMKMLKLQY